MEALIIAGMATCVLALVALKLVGDPERKHARRVIAAAPELADDSPDGAMVRVTGVVRAIDYGERFISPLSEARCVVYRTRVSARRGNFAYASLHDEQHIRAFVLERGTAPPIVIDSARAVLDVAPAKLSRGFTRKVELLRTLGLHDANAAQSQFEEVVVELDATVTIAGTLARTLGSAPRDGERPYREGAAPTLCLVGDQAHPIAIRVE